MSKRIKKSKKGVQQRTLSLPLPISQEQHELYTEVIDHYNAAYGDVIAWCKENESVNRTRLQKEMYHQIREWYPDLPAQFVSIALRDAAGAVKSWNSNNRKRKWKMKSRRRKQSLGFDLRVMSLRGQMLSLGSFVGWSRQKFLLTIPAWFEERYPEAKVNAAKLILRPDGSAQINLIYRIPDTEPRIEGRVVGIDRGIKKITATSEGGEERSARVRGVKRKYAHNRRTLQSKGTRSAKRRLRAMSGREERFVRDVNHVISRKLADDADVAVYVLEDLTGIAWRKEKKRRLAGRKMRTWLSNWSYFQLETFIEYKCRAKGIEVEYVSPAYTSQRCNHCGHTDKRSRKGENFECVRCGHVADADVNAAKNIRDKYLLHDGAGRMSTAHMDGDSERVARELASFGDSSGS